LSRRDEFYLHHVQAVQMLEKWEVDFIGLINPPTKHLKEMYIITIEYLTFWDEAKPIRYFSIDTVAKFIFGNIITWFGCPQILTSDQGACFISNTIATLTCEFLIQHHKTSPYHPQENGTVKSFKKIMEQGLTKVCFTNRDDWDERVPTMLQAYRTMKNKVAQVYSIPIGLS
jgi:hypothetical protein